MFGCGFCQLKFVTWQERIWQINRFVSSCALKTLIIGKGHQKNKETETYKKAITFSRGKGQILDKERIFKMILKFNALIIICNSILKENETDKNKDKYTSGRRKTYLKK